MDDDPELVEFTTTPFGPARFAPARTGAADALGAYAEAGAPPATDPGRLPGPVGVRERFAA